MIYAFSDAGFHPRTHQAHLAVIIGEHTHQHTTHAASSQEAELLAAQLAVELLPSGARAVLRLDNKHVCRLLRARGQARPLDPLRAWSDMLLERARERQVKVYAQYYPEVTHPAHPLTRPPEGSPPTLEKVRVHVRPSEVRVTGAGLHLTLPNQPPAGLHALRALVSALPDAMVDASASHQIGQALLVRGAGPLTRLYFEQPALTPEPQQAHVLELREALARKQRRLILDD